MSDKFQAKQVWIYRQSLRPYIILKTTINDIHYTAATITAASGKIFIRNRKDFEESFCEPNKLTQEAFNKAIDNTLKRLGLKG